MNKKILFIGLLLFQCARPDSAQKLAECLKTKPSPSDTVFFIDYHNVIAYTDWRQGLNTLWYNEGAFSRMGYIGSYYASKLLRRAIVKDSSLLDYLDKDATPGYQETNLALVNAYYIDDAMVKLLEDVKARGYHMILFSNTPKTTIKYQEDHHPAVFALFDKVWAREPGSGVTKKSPEAFEQIKTMARNVVPGAKKFIFIDDTQKNLDKASPADICGLHFKSVDKTRAILRDIGVLEA